MITGYTGDGNYDNNDDANDGESIKTDKDDDGVNENDEEDDDTVNIGVYLPGELPCRLGHRS